LCIIMEYADGGDLAQRIEHQTAMKTPFPEHQVLDWFVQICLALKHAHDRLILHRDLKPQNIFLTVKNFVRLGDFGISRVLTNTQSVASTCVGTPLYLAPELCEGRSYKEKGDVWSLGAILYELCMLSPPFTANTMPALVMRICHDEPLPIAGDYCDETKAVALKLLCKNPDERPRVHDVLAMHFIKSRIEVFLDPDAIIDEFSHTVIRDQPPVVNESISQPRPVFCVSSVAASAGRPKSTGSTDPSTAYRARTKSAACLPGVCVEGATNSCSSTAKRTQSRGGVATVGTASSIVCNSNGCGGNVGKYGTSRAADARRQLSESLEVTSRAETSAQRAQRLKEDEGRRLAQREQMRRDRLAYAKMGGKAEPSATEIVEQAVVGQQASMVQQVEDFADVDCDARAALEAAFPGARLLTQEERRLSHDSLLRRQQEVVSRVQKSQLKGEKGRIALNEAQRELLDIARIRAATSKRYVLLQMGSAQTCAAAPPLGSMVAGVPVEEIGHIDEDETEMDDEREGEESDGEAAEKHGSDTISVSQRDDGRSDATFEGAKQGSSSAAMMASMVSDAQHRHGGMKFDVTLAEHPRATKRAPQRAAVTASAVADSGVDNSTALNVPAQLFGVGRPLSSKVERLRTHLEEKLGSKEAFERVFDYVSREESGAQESGEREEILSFMADQRALLPLVHTLLYLEEALDVRRSCE